MGRGTIKVSEIRKMIKGMKPDQEIPISIAYGDDVINNVFVRLDDVALKRPTTPGNIHDRVDKAIFVTVSLVDGEAEAEGESRDDEEAADHEDLRRHNAIDPDPDAPENKG
jgi:hypothetical protein